MTTEAANENSYPFFNHPVPKSFGARRKYKYRLWSSIFFAIMACDHFWVIIRVFPLRIFIVQEQTERWNPWKATKACIKDPLINIFQNSISVCNISVSIIIHQNKKKTYIQKISCLKKFVLQKIRFQKNPILINFDKNFGIKHVNKDLVLKDWSSNKYVDLKFFVPKNILTSFLAGIF